MHIHARQFTQFHSLFANSLVLIFTNFYSSFHVVNNFSSLFRFVFAFFLFMLLILYLCYTICATPLPSVYYTAYQSLQQHHHPIVTGGELMETMQIF